MSPDEIQAIRERAENANAEMDRLTAGSPGANWRWSIPANPERDTDLILAASTADVPTLLAEVERLLGERENIETGFKSFMRTFDQMAARLDKVRALAVKYGGDHMCGDSPEHCGSCVATEMLQATDGSDQ